MRIVIGTTSKRYTWNGNKFVKTKVLVTKKRTYGADVREIGIDPKTSIAKKVKGA